ncbi:MAG: hypothetical protein JO317_04035, partial [Verrucomicrobiae bacterium]|nr:hypothetical protein [Verrucomicrobiae bacterium]
MRPLFSVLAAAIASACALLAGCATHETEIRQEQAAQRQTIDQLQQKQSDLNANLESMQEENARLHGQIDELRAQLEASSASNQQSSANYAKDIARLDDLVDQLNHAREKDRQAILDQV